LAKWQASPDVATWKNACAKQQHSPKYAKQNKNKNKTQIK